GVGRTKGAHTGFQLIGGAGTGGLEADDDVGDRLAFECHGTGNGCGPAGVAAALNHDEEHEQRQQGGAKHLVIPETE
ncbi:MAG: hypothetical protein ACKPJJ_26545, partial [Planctomycetaceae bacterium]